MSKTATIAALKRSAIENFARHGFEAASVRTIAADAGVPLSAVHIYFGSKSELYNEVGRQAWNEVQQERLEILEAARAQAPRGILRISDLIRALSYPVVRRALSAMEYDVAEIRIIRSVVWPGAKQGEQSDHGGDAAIQGWIDQLMTVCTPLTRAEVVWAYSLVVGAIYSWQLIDHRYDKFLPEGLGTIEEVVEDIVAFGTEGMRALIRRREAGRDGIYNEVDQSAAAL